MSVIVDQIVVSDKFKQNNEGFKYFIGYQEGGIVKPLCIILPQMSGYIKYFEKICLFSIKDDELWEKYEKNWDVIKNIKKKICIILVLLASLLILLWELVKKSSTSLFRRV